MVSYFTFHTEIGFPCKICMINLNLIQLSRIMFGFTCDINGLAPTFGCFSWMFFSFMKFFLCIYQRIQRMSWFLPSFLHYIFRSKFECTSYVWVLINLGYVGWVMAHSLDHRYVEIRVKYTSDRFEVYYDVGVNLHVADPHP